MTRMVPLDEREPFQPGLRGAVRDSSSARGLGGYRVAAFDAQKGREGDPLAVTVTHANGEFLLVYRDRTLRERLAKGDDAGPLVALEVRNRFGRVVAEVGPLAGAARVAPICIEVDVDASADRPAGPQPVRDLTARFGAIYKAECSVLAATGVTDLRALLDADISRIAERAKMPLTRLEALRLHAEMAHVEGFDREAAAALVAAGVKSRERLAGLAPPALMRAVMAAEGTGPTEPRRRFSASKVYGWVGYAKGIDPSPFASRLDVRGVLADAKVVTDAVRKITPGVSIIAVAGLLNPFNRFQAVAEARSLMDAAGVGDLSSLGTFRVRGHRVVHPGCYVAWPLRSLSPLPFARELTSTLLQRGGAYRRFNRVEALDDALRIVPNPISDAVIIGSVVEFVEDGRLVIGRDVSSLTIITEEILYSQINEIGYEDRDRSPEPRAPKSPSRAETGTPRNDRNVYSPGAGNNGRDGGNGSQGAAGDAGSDGDTLGAAPNVTIFVQRTPQGLPDIHVGGRRGGTGQPGQHGGHGSDGARGRGACSGACYCHRGPGRGGSGGSGGRGGDGGVGGAGGSAGDLKICTLTENVLALATGRPYFVNLAGGAGGNGGSAGLGGEAGRGGAPGDDSWPWCEEEPSRVGGDGSRGADGAPGGNGPPGGDGAFTLQPITLSDWNAVFNQPWIVRLEPWSGVAGSSVHVVARNLTSDVVPLIDGAVIAPSALDIVAGTLEFVVPPTASGGRRSVQLRVQGVNGPVYSNTVDFRVLPALASISPNGGVPGTPIALTGSGFVIGAQVRFAATTFPATFRSSTQLEWRLPDHENIGTDAGTKTVQVVNPDGNASGTLNFELVLDIVVRVKAWRVFPDIWIGGGGGFGGPGPDRDDDDVRDVLIESDNPADVWRPHRIVLQVDPNVGVAVVPADWAESWPIDDVAFTENEAVIKATDGAGQFLHFEPGAVNVYFVDDIDDWTTHAYTYRGSESTRREFVIYEDTPLLSDWEEAHVAAHELGHVFGLPHVCGEDGDETFGRACTQGSDPDFLMYPSTNLLIDEGNTITVEEARIARRVARLWHGL